MTIATDKFQLASLIPDKDGMGGSQAKSVSDAVVRLVNSDRASRKVDIKKNWNLYQGDHEQYFIQRRNEDNEVFNYRKDNASILNYSKFIIDLDAKYAYGRPEKVRRQFSVDESNKTTEDRMRHLEALIGVQEFMLTTKRHAGIYGEQAIRFIPLDERTRNQVSGRVTQTTFPYPVLLDPLLTFPLRNKWGELDAIVIIDSYTNFVTEQKVTTRELVVNDSRWYWEDDALVSAEVNTYLLNEEFYVFSNNDMRKDNIEPISGLQIQVDEAWTDAAHFFQRHGWPQMVTKVDLSDVIHNPNYVWQISSDNEGGKISDDIDFLTWDGKISEAMEYLDKLESAILKLSSTAAIATGDLKATGQLRSGAALVTAHGPSIQNATEKQVIWERNEMGFFLALASFDSRIRGVSLDTRYPQFLVKVTFPDDFVPGEELVRAEIDSMSMNSHTTTIREIQRRKHPTASEEEITKLRDEVIADSTELTDSKREFVTEQKENGGEDKQPIKSSKKKSNEQPKQ